jgi:hypothetical protein
MILVLVIVMISILLYIWGIRKRLYKKEPFDLKDVGTVSSREFGTDPSSSREFGTNTGSSREFGADSSSSQFVPLDINKHVYQIDDQNNNLISLTNYRGYIDNQFIDCRVNGDENSIYNSKTDNGNLFTCDTQLVNIDKPPTCTLNKYKTIKKDGKCECSGYESKLTNTIKKRVGNVCQYDDNKTCESLTSANDDGSCGAQNVPYGTIIAWNNDTIPGGWAVCDGTNDTPDLRGRFILAGIDNDSIGKIGGERAHLLTIEEMPSHRHSINGYMYRRNGINNVNIASGGPAQNLGGNMTTTNTGGGNAHNNLPPYVVLRYIMKK